MKKIFNKIRYQYHISLIARYALLPVMALCELAAKQIKMKVWVNGGSVDYDGFKIAFPKNVGVYYSSGIFWNGVDGFEPDTWAVIKCLLNKSSCFIDVGSNIGLYSVLARKQRHDIKIISFEPIPSIYKKNLAMHKANSCSPDNLLNIAIGDNNEIAEIVLPVVTEAIEEQTTATLRVDSWQRTKECQRFDVKVVTLDSYLSDFRAGERVLIKIDVEDFESNVFHGAVEFIKTIKPAIVCEILPREHGNQETFDAIEANGYVAFGITSAGLFRFKRDDFKRERSFTDFLLVHEVVSPQTNYLPLSEVGELQW
jgi:FkbM family methyltransferase